MSGAPPLTHRDKLFAGFLVLRTGVVCCAEGPSFRYKIFVPTANKTCEVFLYEDEIPKLILLGETEEK